MRTVILSALLLIASVSRVLAADDPEPVIRGRVALSFPGAAAFSWSKLADVAAREIDRFERSGFDPIHADDAADRILRFYLVEGHARAQVEYTATRADAASGRITFEIDEGPRILIGEVSFEGNGAVDSKKLDRFIRRKIGFFGAPVLVEARLESDLGDIETYYANRGYLRARVGPPEMALRGEGNEVRADIRIPVSEGPRTRLDIRDIALSGSTDVREGSIRLAIERITGGRRKVPFNHMLPYRMRNVLLEMYGRNGFPFSKVGSKAVVSENGKRVAIVFEIEEGEEGTVAAIDIDGNRHVPTSVILRELAFEHAAPVADGGTIDIGTVFDVRRVRNGQSALLRTGLFTSVRIDPKPLPDVPGGIALAIRVTERDPERLDLRVGWGSYEMLRVGAVYEHLCWNGLGEALGLDWAARALRARITTEASMKSVKVGGQLRDARIFMTRIESVLDISAEQRENVSFSYRRTAADLGFGRKLREIDSKLRAEAGWTYSVTEVYDVDGDLDPEFEDVVNVASVALGLVREWRDNPVWPLRGGHVAVRAELADRKFGGELDFFRATVDGSLHIPVSADAAWRFVLAGRVGAIYPRGDTDEIPLSERFFNGGATTVRSHEEQKLGPRKKGEPLGGEAMTTWNAEFRFPILGLLHGALFADAGNVASAVDDLGFEDMGYGLGAGLRARTPVGPLRLDLGWNPDPGSGDPDWVLHFAVGFAF
jgi:outer membrane protein insertion porin family